MNTGVLIGNNNNNHRRDYTAESSKYQWIPSEVFVSSGGTAKFQSYINNLHPVLHTKVVRSNLSIPSPECIALSDDDDDKL